MMNGQRYRIGDVANLIGVSRDTLRYYEKRGILSTEKDDNGYRFYTQQDIAKLTDIIYQRKMDISLNDIEQFWISDSCYEMMSAVAEKRLLEEQQAIFSHQQTIQRLKQTQQDCDKLIRQMHQVSIEQFPGYYVIIPDTSMEKSVSEWFSLSQSHSGMDMTVTFDAFEYSGSSHMVSISYQNSQILLPEQLSAYVDYPLDRAGKLAVSSYPCLHYITASSSRIPEPSAIAPMIEWAGQNQIELAPELYSTFLMQGAGQGCHTYYLELYIPLAA